MDYREQTVNIIKSYNLYKNNGDSSSFIKAACQYFDNIKTRDLSPNEIQFLYFIANKIGIPQYYDMLNSKFKDDSLQLDSINLLTFGAMINDSSLLIGKDKLHKYQKELLMQFTQNRVNRFILSAPTSFGKTFLTYQIIEKMSYANIVLIFPTISLLSENYEKLLNKIKTEQFWGEYSVHTLSDDTDISEKNIWVLTPERFLSLIDLNGNLNYDFIFIDEIYKIDNEYIIDIETKGENERDTAYRLALEYACRYAKDILLAGPYMEIQKENSEHSESLQNFINDKSFEIINYNNIEIVNKELIVIKGRAEYEIDKIKITMNNKNEFSKVASILNALTNEKENSIVYFATKAGVENYAKKITPFLNTTSFSENNDLKLFTAFVKHLEHEFGADWVVVKSLKNRIGVHHGLVPKYVQKQIIEFFNLGLLTVLISTTTITEGVNTTAKNIIIRSDKKGIKTLRHFDAMNIAGRAGRFYHHYTGRVIVVNNKFNEIYESEEDILKHKNFDKKTLKNDIDYLITDEKYLKEQEKEDKVKMYMEVDSRNIPRHIIEQFKVVGIREKLKVYDMILVLSDEEIAKIKSLISAINYASYITWDGFQVVISIIKGIVTDANLLFLMNHPCKSQEQDSNHVLLTAMVHYYLKDGFSGVLKNSLNSYDIDKAMRKSADLVYNVFKYQLVKYLGVFDLMYKCAQVHITKKKFEDIVGISKLIKRLEYSVLTENGRMLSDYGVPYKVVNYYENGDYTKRKDFDSYEQYIDNKITPLLK